MGQPQEREGSPVTPAGESDAPIPAASPARTAVSSFAPLQCPACGTIQHTSALPPVPNYVYAIGRIEPRFPRISVEKEWDQVKDLIETKGLSERQVLRKAVEENYYLARQLCWVLTVEGLDTYLLYPRDSLDLSRLIETIRGKPSPIDIDVVIGTRGPLASPELCNGLVVPVVMIGNIYSFDRDELIKGIPRPEEITAEDFAKESSQLFERIVQMTATGSSDEHRAINYLSVRSRSIYRNYAEAVGRKSSLIAIETRPSRLSETRKIVEVIFVYAHPDKYVTEKEFVRVDVTEEFPFIVTKLSPYYG